MATIAVASMVRFTGRQDARARSVATESTTAPRQTEPDGLVVPVQGVRRSQISDTWGQSRADGQRAHQGADIMAPAGAPVLAAVSGTVEKLFESRAGGRTVYVRSDNRRWSYYYAHLAAYAENIREGARVRAGQKIGYVGDTGNAGAGNYHLHFGVARMSDSDRWWQGTPVNPYPLLVGGRPRR